MILTDEFSRQASMEQDLGIPSALFAAPVREIVELGKSQVGFMNMFAIPLFQGVTNVMPAMEFAVDELQRNKSAWEYRIQEEQAKARHDSDDSGVMDGVFSPRTMSLATSSATSHHKTNTTPSTARSSHDSEIRIKALLNKSPFSPPNGALDESPESARHPSLPEFSISRTDSDPSPSDVTLDTSEHSSEPNQPQPDHQDLHLLEHGTKDAQLLESKDSRSNSDEVKAPPATNPGIITCFDKAACPTQSKQRSSYTTEESNSAGAESTSQSTSATTNKLPISQATSVRSGTSLEKHSTLTAAGIGADHASPGTGSATSTPVNGSPDESARRQETHEGKSPLMETVRNLRKKPSRFRVNSLNFWKRSKSDSPPISAEVRGDKLATGSEDEGSQWS
jgi:3',5'-cyclic-nucleotide phosphodiesterase